ncbi:kinase-like domain-containing protein [Hyaloraphidium curvatum]|nr:kinase-like domain-containing protein [Hyaloraphidium curvatum]
MRPRSDSQRSLGSAGSGHGQSPAPSGTPRFSSFEEGKRRLGHYKTVKELGHGTSGVVRLCRVRGTRDLVAVKEVLKKRLDGDDAGRKGSDGQPPRDKEAAFFNEVRALQTVNNHNLCHIVDVFETATSYFLVMEYCSGGDLLALIDRIGHFSEKAAASTVATILNALLFVHRHGIVHRDVKPANLLLRDRTTSSPLVLMDFGSAFFVSEGEMRRMAGTPYYLSPEMVKGEAYGEKTDIWSLGVVAYTLIYGETPFESARDMETLKKRILNVDFQLPEKSGHKNAEREYTVSEVAKSFLRMVLEADPAKRPTAEEALSHEWFCINVSEGYRLLLKTFNHEADPGMFPKPHFSSTDPEGHEGRANQDNITSRTMRRLISEGWSLTESPTLSPAAAPEGAPGSPSEWSLDSDAPMSPPLRPQNGVDPGPVRSMSESESDSDAEGNHHPPETGPTGAPSAAAARKASVGFVRPAPAVPDPPGRQRRESAPAPVSRTTSDGYRKPPAPGQAQGEIKKLKNLFSHLWGS